MEKEIKAQTLAILVPLIQLKHENSILIIRTLLYNVSIRKRKVRFNF